MSISRDGSGFRNGINRRSLDPVVDLHFPDGSVLTNDNWRDNSPSDLSLLSSVQLTPSSDSESALVATLDPGAYTVVLRGKGMDTGIGLVEVFDLNALAGSQAANLSGRGLVETGDDVMIGGFIVGPVFGAPATIVVRALGPSLSQQGVSSPLSDPRLELHDGNGAILTENDNWADGPDAATIPLWDSRRAPPRNRPCFSTPHRVRTPQSSPQAMAERV